MTLPNKCIFCRDEAVGTENGLPVCASDFCNDKKFRRIELSDVVVLRERGATHFYTVIKPGDTVNHTVGLPIAYVVSGYLDDDKYLESATYRDLGRVCFFSSKNMLAPLPFPIENELPSLENERLGLFPDSILESGYGSLKGFDSDARLAVIMDTLLELQRAENNEGHD